DDEILRLDRIQDPLVLVEGAIQTKELAHSAFLLRACCLSSSWIASSIRSTSLWTSPEHASQSPSTSTNRSRFFAPPSSTRSIHFATVSVTFRDSSSDNEGQSSIALLSVMID